MGQDTIARKILLADDSVTIQKVVRLTLGQTPHKLFDCKNTDELFKFLKRTPVDLVLLDFTLSQETDGYNLTTHLKNQFPEVKVIILYGTFDVVNEEKLKAHLADDFIIKPFESTRFLEKCFNLLGDNNSGFQSITETANPEVAPDPTAGWEMHEFRPEKTAKSQKVKPLEIEDTTKDIELPALDLNDPLEPLELVEEESHVEILHEMTTNPNLNFEVEDWGVAVPPPSAKQSPEPHPEPHPDPHPEIESPENLWDSDPVLGETTDKPPMIPVTHSESIEDLTIQTTAAPIAAPNDQWTKEMISEKCTGIIEKIAWEVIPELAEKIIARELEKLRISTENEIRGKVSLK